MAQFKITTNFHMDDDTLMKIQKALLKDLSNKLGKAIMSDINDAGVSIPDQITITFSGRHKRFTQDQAAHIEVRGYLDRIENERLEAMNEYDDDNRADQPESLIV